MAQNDTKKWWFLLDSGHSDYTSIIANLQVYATLYGETYSNVAGRNAGERVVYSYMPAATKSTSSPSLDISASGCVKDAYNYSPCNNPGYAVPTLRTDPNRGDSHIKYGQFLENPQTLPTDGIDRIVEYLKGNGTDTILFLAAAAHGAGDGTSYRARRAFSDVVSDDSNPGGFAVIDPRNYSLVVLCGTISRYKNEGLNYAGVTVGMVPKTGTSGVRTCIVSHPADPAILMGASKFGAGVSYGGAGLFDEDADFTFDSGTTWYINHGAFCATQGGKYFCLGDSGGTLRVFTQVYSLATCRSTTNSFFTQADSLRTYVNDGIGNPHGHFYAGGVGCLVLPYRASYFDLYGITFYNLSWHGTPSQYSSDWRAIGCKMLYGGYGKLWDPLGGDVQRDTGQFVNTNDYRRHITPETPNNVQWIGCEIGYCGDGYYPVSLNCVVPTSAVFWDNYFHHIGIEAYGVNIADSDSHSIGNEGGFDSAIIRNNRFYRCSQQTIALYVADIGFRNRNTTITDGSITNGTFTTNLSGWTVGGTVTQASGKAHFANGSLEQAVTIGAAYKYGTSARAHALKFYLTPGTSISVQVGTISGASDIAVSQSDGSFATGAVTIYPNPEDGTASVAFRPDVTTFYVQFTTTGTLDLDNVQLLTNLASEDGYVRGFPAVAEYAVSGSADKRCFQTMRGVAISFNHFSDAITHIENSTLGDEGAAISLTGDVTYDETTIQLTGISIYGNRIDGGTTVSGAAVTDGYQIGIRDKWQVGSPFDQTRIIAYNNVISGTYWGFRSLVAFPDSSGNNVDGSYYLHNNQIHAFNRYILISASANPARHRQILDNNNYPPQSGVLWENGGFATYATLALWRAAAGTNDNYDNSSTTNAIHVSAGTASVAISGTLALGNTLTAVVTGATYNQSLMWLRDGEEIAGASSTTYVVTAKDVASGNVTVCLMYQDVSGLTDLATGWNITTSAAASISSFTTPSVTPGSRAKKKSRALKAAQEEEAAPELPKAVQTGVVAISPPPAPIIRRSSELQAALDQTSSVQTMNRPKVKKKNKDDDWFILS